MEMAPQEDGMGKVAAAFAPLPSQHPLARSGDGAEVSAQP